LRIVYDMKLFRPACVLLQAAMGGDHNVVSANFDARYWLVNPTNDMKLYELSEEELKQAVEITEKLAIL